MGFTYTSHPYLMARFGIKEIFFQYLLVIQKGIKLAISL